MIRARGTVTGTLRSLLVLVVGAVSATATADFNLPEFGEPADATLPLHQERELGREVYQQIRAYNLILDDPELGAYIQDLGNTLVEASPEARGKPFTFFIIRDPSINAFALPGGYIGMHTGLIRAAQTEAEVAGVLAHEIAHVTQRHIARRMDSTSGWDLASAALLLAAIAAGGGDPDVVQAALGIGMSMSYQQRVNFTRAHELEADRLGIGTLAAAGFDPVGMENFFRRMAAQARLYGDGIPELLRTHPYSTTRMAEARNRRSNLPTPPDRPAPLFELMRTRAALAEIDLAGEKLAQFPADDDAALPQAYGAAMALRAKGEHAAALVMAQRALSLVDTDEQRTVMRFELARALYANGKRDQAMAQLREISRANSLDHAATLQLARWELAGSQPAQARQRLLESEAFAADEPEVFRLLARAAGDMNDPAEVQYQMANWHLSRGNWLGAIHQLRRALAREEWDDYTDARLRGRLDNLLARAPQRVRDELRRNPDGHEDPPGTGRIRFSGAGHAHLSPDATTD